MGYVYALRYIIFWRIKYTSKAPNSGRSVYSNTIAQLVKQILVHTKINKMQPKHNIDFNYSI